MAAETILIVDDDPICLTLASIALRHAGFTTETAADGMDALDLLQTLRPDLILSDIQMPNMDGFAFARRTRQIDRFRHVPMIALTGCTGPGVEQQAYDAGFTSYITKPINSAGLAARVRRHLQNPCAPCA